VLGNVRLAAACRPGGWIRGVGGGVTERILMIEDDEALSAMVGEYLGGVDYAVTACPDAAAGLAALERGGFDALVLDVMLPDLDGFEVCRRIRATSDIPILMLTARGDETDRIVGLELGADDYLPKPFNPRELLARLRAILRRRTAEETRSRALRFGRLEIDRDARVVRVDGEERPLTGYQFDLLCALAESAGRVMTRDVLMERVRGSALEAFDRSIDVHVSRVRAAIEDDPKHPRRILTVRGTGYVFARSQDGDA
jgi:DNA-binding response OmpR family regulator